MLTTHWLPLLLASSFFPFIIVFFLSTQLHFGNIYGAVPYPDQNSFGGNIWGTSFISLFVCTACFMHSWTLKTCCLLIWNTRVCYSHTTRFSVRYWYYYQVYLILATALCSWFPELRVTECQIIFTIFLNQWSDFINYLSILLYML